MNQETELNVELLQTTFASLSSSLDELVKRFYEELFAKYPDVKPLFKDVDPKQQQKKLAAGLNMVINSLKRPEILAKALGELGRKHKIYGATAEHYPAVAETLLSVMQEFAGDTWTDEVHEAWSNALSTVAKIMLDAYEEPEDESMNQETNTEEPGLKISLLEDTFNSLAPQGEALVARFYEVLFERHPGVKPLFKNTDQKEQEKKLLSALVLVINNLRKPDVLGPALTNLGKNHQKYGAVAEHYGAVAAVLLDVMAEFAGDAWTDEVHEAWSDALNTVAGIMLEAYEGSDVNSLNEENDVNEMKDSKTDKSETKNVEVLEMNAETNDMEALKQKIQEQSGLLNAIDKVQAVIEFNMDGTIITANDNFLNALGYTLEEVQGQHHSMFADEAFKASAEYKKFWASLNRGEYEAKEYKRIGKGGKEVWINASYNPVFDTDGKPYKVVKYATDVTAQKLEFADFSGKLAAVDKVQATIEFELDGTIITANDNFLNTVGYSLEEIKGKHHSMFVDPEYVAGAEYKEFWQKLASGEYQSGQYRRIGKDGSEIWLNASYNPIYDMNGNPFKVVKYATDGTELREQQIASARLQVAVDGCQSPMIMIDRDFIITYVNGATVGLLTRYESKFKEVCPSFSVAGVMGTCIDVFHKNPEHQRKLLADPSNLPYKTDIEIRELKFALTVSAQMDPQGNYIGNTLEWEDVTEIRAKNIEVARLQSAVDGAQTNLMICDVDLNITYANPAVVEMLRNRQNDLRTIWPSLDVNNLVGQNIDQFHKNPAHQRRLLSDVNSLPTKAEINVGPLDFSVNATAIIDVDGNYAGNMVEWQDITEQKIAERAINSLIEAAGKGDLEQRLDSSKYEGFLESLATSINSLIDSVVTPVNEGTRVMEALADGDLTQVMDGDFHGKFAVMKDAVNTSSTNLLNMVNEIRSSSGSIDTSSTELVQGNTELSSRTEQQASALEETAATIEEMTGTVKQNADNARQANQLANSARETAEKGGSVVSNAVTAMSEINSSSKKIADIIGVIDEIAFQTNLLALNAAVEAARAGEQGRGFAVVASEVRNLAQRSAGAAKEIKTLINDSVEKVDEGSKLVDESGSNLDEIVLSVKKVSDIIAEIAAAGEEQYVGIEQINKAVSEMDEMTQQNAALVEEAAAASQSLNEQSQNLEKLISEFNIGDGAAMINNSADERPWNRDSEKPQARSSAPTRAPAVKKAASSGDDEWEEF